MNLNWLKTLFSKQNPVDEPITQVPKPIPLRVKDLIIKNSDDKFSDMIKNVQPLPVETETFTQNRPLPRPIPGMNMQPMQPIQQPVQYIQPMEQQYPQPTFREMMHDRAQAKVNQMFGHGKTNEQLGQIYGSNPGSDLRGKI